MRLAFAAGAVVGVLAPAVGFFLVQRRMSLIGDGIGHVAFAGVAAGLLLGVSPVLTALVAAVAGGVAIEWLRARAAAAGDQALALVFYTGIAAGVVLVSLGRGAGRRPLPVPVRLDPDGHARAISRSIAILGAVGLATIALLYRALSAVVLDEEGARVAGVPVGALNVAVAVARRASRSPSRCGSSAILLIAALMVLPVTRREPRRVEHALDVPALDGDRAASRCSRPDGRVLRRPAARRDDRARRRRRVRAARGRPADPRPGLGLGGDASGVRARLVAVAAARLVLLGRADHDGLAGVGGRRAVDQPLRRRRRPTAAVAYRLELVDELGVREQLRDHAERLPPEVLVETGNHDANSAVGEDQSRVHDGRLEELHLVDADDLGVADSCEQLRDRGDRDRAHARTRVADDIRRVEAVVYPGPKIATRWPAISTLRRRLIISSLLPLNIGPQTTSSQPPR